MALFRSTEYKLAGLVDEIDRGVIGLPDIQRPFVWKNTQVRDLFDSMYRGYPIGHLLFWENAHQENARTIGSEHNRRVPRFLIVDGQQRLTSLFAVIKGKEVVRENYEKERVIISFNPLDDVFVVPDASTRNDPVYVQDIAEVWSTENFNRFTNEYLEKLRTTRGELTDDQANRASDALGKLRGLEHFLFSVLEISATASEEEVAQIFVRINSKGKRLKETDFVLTLMSVFWDEGRFELEDFARAARVPTEDKATAFNYIFQPDPDQVLRVSIGYGFKRARMKYAYSILRGKDLKTEEFSDIRRDEQFKVLKEAQEKTLNLNNWHEFLKALKEAGYTRNALITSSYNVMYAYIVFLIGKYDFEMETPALRKLISRWFFFISLTGRYTGSAETQMEEDLNAIEKRRSAGEGLEDILVSIITTEITSDYWSITLPTSGLVSGAARNPAMSAYYAALNILGAKVLFSNLTTVQLMEDGVREKRAALERHHLFPRKYLKRSGVKDDGDINQVANYALVEWTDNNDISDDPPSKYLPGYLARFNDDEAARKQAYYWHALPDGWEQMEYPDFLVERRKRMAEVIKDAFQRLK